MVDTNFSSLSDTPKKPNITIKILTDTVKHLRDFHYEAMNL